MKIFLGFLFQFSIHQEIGVAKKYSHWSENSSLLCLAFDLYHLFSLLDLLLYYCRFIYYILYATYIIIFYLDMNTLILYNTSIRVCG